MRAASGQGVTWVEAARVGGGWRPWRTRVRKRVKERRAEGAGCFGWVAMEVAGVE